EEARRAHAMLGPFGESDEPLLVLIESQNVLTLPALRYQHRIAQHLAAQHWAARVDGVTITALPHFAEGERETATLEELDLDRNEIDPEIQDALGRALATDPRRFPMGFLCLSERAGGRVFEVSPLVSGEVDRKEQRAIAELAARSPAVRGRLI